MRKKEKVAAIAVVVMVAVAVLAAVAFDAAQQRQRADAKSAAEAARAAEDAKRTYPQGATVHVSSGDKDAQAFSQLEGSMDVTVLESKLYDSYEATGLPTGDGHFFGVHDSTGASSPYFLVCSIDIANIDAVALQQSKSGDYDFILGGPDANCASYVYFDGSKENCIEAAMNCFAIDPGEEKTLTVCWQIPQNDGASNLPESVDLDFLGYIITLAPEDCR